MDDKLQLINRQVSKINELLPTGLDKLAIDENKKAVTLPPIYHNGKQVYAGSLTLHDADGVDGTINYLWEMLRAFKFVKGFIAMGMVNTWERQMYNEGTAI